jgi:hypothetical protein
MIHDIPKPDISPTFTIDNIHKIREWNYERRKDATTEELLADINNLDVPFFPNSAAAPLTAVAYGAV